MSFNSQAFERISRSTFLQLITTVQQTFTKRDTEDADPDDTGAGQKEIFASWSLLILIILLIIALFTSYILQTRRIQAVHETVVSVFTGMAVGFILRLTASHSVLGAVSFDYRFFFNLLLPPIILASGYGLHQNNFFRNIGTILTFAFIGTFISAVVLGVILFIWTRIPINGLKLSFVDAISVGATLAATDPVTVLAIFNTYKVDPKLYTIIFGESILNDAIAIVLFETAQKYKKKSGGDGKLSIFSFFESIGTFMVVFLVSLAIGILLAILTSLFLKITMIRRYARIESCLIILIAYASYFFSNAIHMSGIVSLLFCGICMKHYAYHNMSRETQLTTKYMFQVMAQLSENFIFIYLGLSLFTEAALEFKPLFILVTVLGICAGRWCAVFPLSRGINWIKRYRARRRGQMELVSDELPYSYQAMLFWAGLRGAVGVGLAAGLTGPSGTVLRATVLVVVVLTLIIFGGTTARVLEILGIETGVEYEADSDDEFDIERIVDGIRQGGGDDDLLQGNKCIKCKVNSFTGETKDRYEIWSEPDSGIHDSGGSSVALSVIAKGSGKGRAGGSEWSNGEGKGFKHDVWEDPVDDLGLPPVSKSSRSVYLENDTSGRTKIRTKGNFADDLLKVNEDAILSKSHGEPKHLNTDTRRTKENCRRSSSTRTGSASGTLSQLLSDFSEDPASAFRQIDEDYIKPHLLLRNSSAGNANSPGGRTG